MKKAIKRISQILLAALLCIIVIPVRAEAAGEVVLKAGSAKGSVGDEITIPVSISNSSEVAALDLTVVYDPEELSFIRAAKGESVEEGNICDINHVTNTNYIRFIFTSLEEIPADGKVMELKFLVLDDEQKKHTVDLDVLGVLNMDIEDLDWKTEGGREIAPIENVGGSDSSSSVSGDSVNSFSENNSSSLQGNGAEEDPDERGTASSRNGEEDASDRKNTADSRMESDGTEKRFIVMTEDGLKDVTDTTARETSENLSSGSGSTQETSGSKPVAMIGIATVVILLLAVSGGVILRTRKKRKKGEEE